jgi:hypothetical protein
MCAGFPALVAQGLTGQVSGTVLDPTSRAVPDARVELKNSATGQRRTVTSNESGDFVFTEVLPGKFDLSIIVRGFRKIEQAGIVLFASQRLALDPIELTLGETSDIVFVEANPAQLQTESAERSGTLDSHQMQELSVKSRDYLAMLKLLPGVLDINNATREAPGGTTLQGIYINGNRQGSLNLTLDGISTMDTGGGTGPYLAPSIDAISEVKVLLTNYQAEYGRSSGGTINTVIKSGTKDFHGGAYYYLRNEALNANEFFGNRQGIPRPRYRFNYPGYFVGGPVLVPGTSFNRGRDKLFFFWSQEFLPRNYPSPVAFQTFPTALERQGNFSQTVSQNGQLIAIRDPLTNAPFPGNIVPPSRIDRSGQGLLNIFPLPNAIDPTRTFNYVFRSPIQQPRNDQILRVDWNISSRTQFYARGIIDFEAVRGDFGFTLASPSWPQLPINYQTHSGGFVSTLLHSFSPSRINELTFGVNRGDQEVTPLSDAGLARNARSALHLALPQFFPQSNPHGVVPNATFAGVPSAPQLNIDSRFPYFGVNDVWDYSDNYSQVSGSHNLKFGIYVEHSSKNSQLGTSFNGTFAFDRDPNNPLDTGYAFSNALIGSVNSYTESSEHPIVQSRNNNVEWYAQDSWKATRRLTLEAGARFYLIYPTINAGAQLAGFDPATYNAGQQPALIQPYIDPSGVRGGRDPISGRIFPAVKIGTFSPGSGTPYQGMRVYDESILKTPPVQVAPRAGFAWDVFGTGNSAVRGGFGIFFDRFPDNQVTQLAGSLRW